MRGYRRALCALLAAACLTGPALAADFRDTENHWAGGAIRRWSEYGVLSGYGDGTFGPNDPITRGQMAVILSAMFGWTERAEHPFSDVDEGAWYADGVGKANAAGVLAGSGGRARPNDPITRQEAAVMLDRALKVSGRGGEAAFGDQEQISAWAADAVNGMAAMGFLAGAEDGNFYPDRDITRAEIAAILNSAVVNYYRQGGTYTPSGSGITLVAAPGVTLRDGTVSGSLLISPGAAGSETVLQNLTVRGRIHVQTGKDEIVLLSSSSAEELSLEGEGAKVMLSRDVKLETLTVSASGVQLRGVPEGQSVAVEQGAAGVLVNGHPAEAGAVTEARADLTEDWNSEVEIVIEPSRPGGGSTSGGSGGSGTGNPSDSGSGSGGTEEEKPPVRVDEDGNIIIDFEDLVGR